MVSFKSRVIAICAAGTLAIGSAAVAAPISFAQNGDAAVTEDGATAGAVDRPFGAPAPAGEMASPTAAQADLIDANKTGTLTIKKLLGDPERGDDGATHSGAPTGEVNPLAGAVFNIERLDIDLTKLNGWSQLNDLVDNPQNIADFNRHAEQPAEGEQSKTTGADGEATFSGIPVGVYVVTEQPRDGYSTSAPFLVSLPYSDGQTGKWEYTRTVYPKNQELRPNKQVDAQGAALGSNMKYTINAPVPAGELNRFRIIDELVSQLKLVTTGDRAPSVSVSPSGELTEKDYDFNFDNNTLTVEFTEAGRRKLEGLRQANPNLQVHVQFEATVVSLPVGGRPIRNTAKVEYPNGAEVTTDSPAVDGEDPKPTRTDYANLTIEKYTNDEENTASLAGAEFNLYRCVDKELKGEAIPVDTLSDEPFDPEESKKLKTIESEEKPGEGLFYGYGIPVRTFAAGGTGTQEYHYCVVETKAPEGFIRNPEVHEVELQAATADQAERLFVRVENQRDNFLSSLPATGAWGIILVFLVGLGLLARGFYTSRKDGRAAA